MKTKKMNATSLSWSNLPSDILTLILERLPYVCQIYFRAVCKNWRFNIYKAIKYADYFPWALRFNPFEEYTSKVSNTNLCYLYDPIFKKKYTIENQILVGAQVDASKYGWLLLSKAAEFKCSYIFYFYSPFTGEIIELPKMEHFGFGTIGKATFSTAPTSSDCVICVVFNNWWETCEELKFCVNTCSPRDKIWNRIWLELGGYECNYRRISQLAYLGGVFYLTYKRKRLDTIMVAFKPGLQKWKTYPYPSKPSLWEEHNCIIESHDGNLLMAYYDIDDHRDGIDGNRWKVYEFDPSKMSWCEVDRLGNRMLFLSLISTSFSLPAPANDGGGLANTIHAHTYHDCFSHSYKATQGEVCPQIYDCIEREGLGGVWIHPPEFGTRKVDQIIRR